MTSRAFFLRVLGVCLIAWTLWWLVPAAPALREMLGGGGTSFFTLQVNDREVPLTAVTATLLVAMFLIGPPALLAFAAAGVRALVGRHRNRQQMSDTES